MMKALALSPSSHLTFTLMLQISIVVLIASGGNCPLLHDENQLDALLLVRGALLTVTCDTPLTASIRMWGNMQIKT